MNLLLFYWFSSSVLGSTTNVEIPFEAATTRAVVVIMSLFYIPFKIVGYFHCPIIDSIKSILIGVHVL